MQANDAQQAFYTREVKDRAGHVVSSTHVLPDHVAVSEGRVEAVANSEHAELSFNEPFDAIFRGTVDTWLQLMREGMEADDFTRRRSYEDDGRERKGD